MAIAHLAVRLELRSDLANVEHPGRVQGGLGIVLVVAHVGLLVVERMILGTERCDQPLVRKTTFPYAPPKGDGKVRTGFSALIVGLGLGVGCGGRAEIFVQCKMEANAIVCTAEHMKGTAAGKACWDLVFTCENGTKLKHTSCKVVEPKSKAIVRLESKEIKDFDKCDRVAQSGVENLKVTRP